MFQPMDLAFFSISPICISEGSLKTTLMEAYPSALPVDFSLINLDSLLPIETSTDALSSSEELYKPLPDCLNIFLNGALPNRFWMGFVFEP
mmetsp:Transcript_35303/g.46768  ORF Transcript_35303/g.46768 Transcript_35303/m.46768 type:complete len:91 (-) Transcript_35303:461-733(-)